MAHDDVVIDVAGGLGGGAGTFRAELMRYLADRPDAPIRLIGEGRFLTPRWMVERERRAGRGSAVVSLNNAAFVGRRERSTVLLRNALHFAREEELASIHFRPSRTFRLETQVIRALARQATSIVVPCTRMAERVVDFLPTVAARVTVRFHPTSQAEWAGSTPELPRTLFMPIVNSPYKNLDEHLALLLRAFGRLDTPAQIVATLDPSDLPETLRVHSQLSCVGPLSGAQVAEWLRRSAAVYYPTTVESFGYPLAEARVGRVKPW